MVVDDYFGDCWAFGAYLGVSVAFLARGVTVEALVDVLDSVKNHRLLLRALRTIIHSSLTRFSIRITGVTRSPVEQPS